MNPLLDYRFERAKMNYIDRNLDYYTNMKKASAQKAGSGMKEFSFVPLKHQVHIENGKPVGLTMEMMHEPSGFFTRRLTERKPPDSEIPVPETPSLGVQDDKTFYSLFLGFIYGMQWNGRGPSLCYESFELNFVTIDKLLFLV